MTYINLGLSTNLLCEFGPMSSLPRIKYPLNQLYRSGNTRATPPSNVFYVAKDAGILIYRGWRAGTRKNRQISVQISQRFTRPTPCVTVNYNDLGKISRNAPSNGNCILSQSYNFPVFYLANLRSNNKTHDELEIIMRELNADVCVVTKSLLTNDNVDRYSFEGYTQFSKCRDGRRGGGVLVYAKDDLNPTPVRHFIVPDAMEILWLHLRPKRLPRQVSGLYVAAVYSPPNSTSDALLIDHVIHTIDQLKSKHPFAGFIVLGDLNKLDTAQISRNCNLKQVVDKPTRENAILDKILTSLAKYYISPQIMSPVGMSDHNVVLWSPK